MIVLLDTDVLIDVALNRHPHAGPASQLLDALQKKPGTTYLAWHSLSNFFYLVTPSHGTGATRSFLQGLLRFVGVAPVGTKDALYALKLPFGDLEDSLQCAAAIACGADVIATRNLKDYRRSPIPAQNPESVLKLLNP